MPHGETLANRLRRCGSAPTVQRGVETARQHAAKPPFFEDCVAGAGLASSTAMARRQELEYLRDASEVIFMLFKHVPAVSSGEVRIHAVHRRPGLLTKVVLSSARRDVSALDLVAGPNGTTLQPVANLLGETIDLVPFNENPILQVAYALRPAKLEKVAVSPVDATLFVIVADQSVQDAVTLEGVHLRLAAEVTGCPLVLFSASDWAAGGEHRVPLAMSSDPEQPDRPIVFV